MADWNKLPKDARSRVPPWLPDLMSRYALGGVQLQFPHPTATDEPPAFFTFLPPGAYEDVLLACELSELPQMGFHVFADAGNRDVWVSTTESGPAGDVFLLEASSWDGTQPTVKNGLRHAHTSLAPLLSIAAIGPVGDGDWAAYAIWYQRREEAEEIDSRATMAETRAKEAESRGELADALAAWRFCEELLNMIAEKYPLLFDRNRRAFRTKAARAIRRLSRTAS